MLDLKAKSNTLKLTPTQEKLFFLQMGEIIANHFQNPANLEKFEQEKEKFNKGVKDLETKRIKKWKKDRAARFSKTKRTSFI